MNKRDVFEKVKLHLLAQGKPARNVTGCAYQTRDNLRCAIGCLIPDDHRGLKHLGGITGLLAIYPDLEELWGVESYSDRRFLSVLQGIHDHNPPENWSKELDRVESRYLD